jgi:RsiW-degrading membrane proteinase PrsW (M82 family)
MVVEVVGTVSGAQRFQQVQRRLVVVLVVLTIGMVILWPYEEAHRSVPSFVVTMLWTLAAIALSSMMIAGPDEDPDDDDTGEGPL